MKENKSTYELRIEGNINGLKQSLGDAKKALDNLGESNFANGIDKKINSILVQLDKLQKKASRPLSSKAAFTGLENGFSDIAADAKNLLEELHKISKIATTREKLSLLPEDEAKRYREVLNAISAYDRAIEKAERNRIRQQEKRKAEQSKTSEDLDKAKKAQEGAKKAHADATAKGTKYGDAKAIIEQAEAAKKAQKEIEALEKQLKKYQKRLEELNSIDVDKRTPEQETELATTRSNIKSVGGKIGARKKIANKGPDEKALTAAQKTVETEQPEIDALAEAAAKAEKEVIRLTSALDRLDEAINNNSSEISSSQADYKVLYAEAKRLGVGLEGITEDVNPENIETLKSRMRECADQGVKPLEEAVEQLEPEFEKLEHGAKQAGEGVRQGLEEFSDKTENETRVNNIKENIKQFIGWAGASKVLGAALRNAYQDIKDLDAAMAEIAVVTDFNIGDMWDQMPQYTARANELGIKITEVYEASALFYQQGLDTNEMMALSNETLKMARIAGLDAAEATDRMTAALRGFNMELDEASAQKVADVYSELAAITASDVDEISSAMTKTASIASSAGMEFETTAAFLSQIIETTRESAETAGTAMKTVIARFQELKKSPDEIGEIDGEIVDANAIEGALRSVGVSLRDAGGQFRELDDVFLELSSKWGGLDKNTQRYIATIAAGSRQQSRFIAMMQDYGRTQELVSAATSSAGASQRQFEKTTESLESKLAKLENAWTEFSTGLMNSDIIKFAVDFLTNLLNALNRVTEGVGGLTSSLSKVGTMIAIFQTAKLIINTFFDEVLKNIYTKSVDVGRNIGKGVKEGLAAEKNGDQSDGTEPELNKKPGGLDAIKKGAKIIKTRGELGKARRKVKQHEREQIRGRRESYGRKTPATNVDDQWLQEARGEVDTLEKELANLEKVSFDEIIKGAQTAAQAITMVGVGLGMVGQMFKNAGMEEIGEGFQEVGKYVSFAGSALTALVPVISLLGTTFTIAGKQISLAGIIAQAGWWPLIGIFIILAGVIAGVTWLASKMKKASPEYKLEKTQEAANRAADAADRATESYENLVNAFEGLETGYEALESLTRGTEEWNEAVKNINNSVLDLIQQYPELAKFVDNKGGILTIDLDDENVQQILKDAETSATVAKNSTTLTNLSVAKAEDDLAYKNLDDDAKINFGKAQKAYREAMKDSITTGAAIGGSAGRFVPVIGDVVGAGIGALAGLVNGFFAGEAAKEAVFEDTQKTTEGLARAIADGTIIDTGLGYKLDEEMSEEEFEREYGLKAEELSNYYAQVGDSTEALREFGNQLLETSAQEQAAFSALATSAYQLADTLSMNEEEQTQASNLVDDISIKRIYDKNMESLEGIDFTNEEEMEDNATMRNYRNEAIRAQYGSTARIEGNKVIFRDAEGQQQTEELTSDEIQALIANNLTTYEAKTAIEAAPGAVNKVIAGMNLEVGGAGAKAIENAAKDAEGGNLTGAEAKILSRLDEAELRRIYNEDMEDEEKAAFGTEDDYIQKIKGVGDIAIDTFKNAGESARKFGLILSDEGEEVADNFINTFDFMTSDMAEGFTSKLERVWDISGEEGVQRVQKAYNDLLEGQNEEVKQAITARLNALDWTNAEQLLGFELELQKIYGYQEGEAKELANKLITVIKKESEAVSHLKYTTEVFGDLYHATQKLNAAIEKTADLQWDYEKKLKYGNAKQISDNIKAQLASIIDQYNEAMSAYDYAVDEAIITYASGAEVSSIIGEDIFSYISKDEKTGTYDLTQLQKAINAGQFGNAESDTYKAVIDYFEKLDTANKTAKDQLKYARDAISELEALNEQTEEGFWDLYTQIGDTITAELDKEIELQEKLLDITSEANEKLVSKIQEQINEERQAREQDKSKEEIANLRSRAAYLGMDTSGANALELLELEKEIAEKEQNFQDTLVDQSIEEMSKANEIAREQREKQIELQKAQLDAYKGSEQFQTSVLAKLGEFAKELNNGTEVQKTSLAQQIIASGLLEGMNPKEQSDFWEALKADGAAANVILEELFNKASEDTDETKQQNAALALGIDGLSQAVGAGEGDTLVSMFDLIAKTVGADKNITLSELFTKLEEGEVENATAITSGLNSMATELGIDEGQTLTDLLSALSTSLTSRIGDAASGSLASIIAKLNEDVSGTKGTSLASLIEDFGTKLSNNKELPSLAELINTLNIKTGGAENNTVVSQLQQIEEAIKENEKNRGIKEKIASAGAKDESFKSSTGFDIAGSGNEMDFKNDDNTYDSDKIQNYQNSVNKIATDANKSILNASTSKGQEVYESISPYTETYKSDEKPLTSGQFYSKLNEEKTVKVGEMEYTHKSLSDALSNGDAEGIKKYSYEGYIESYKSFNGIDPSEPEQGGPADSDNKTPYEKLGAQMIPADIKNWEKTGQHYQLGIIDKVNRGRVKIGEIASGVIRDKIEAALSDPVGANGNKHLVLVDGSGLYARRNIQTDNWYKVVDDNTEKGSKHLNTLIQGAKKYVEDNKWKELTPYKTGGLADFTGPAWLDGTPSKPEYVLNAAQTERFFSLIDVLENYDSDKKKTEEKSGDNYFDINISVEKIESDYDVEQMANKIRRLIYEDASYRNVNSISWTR